MSSGLPRPPRADVCSAVSSTLEIFNVSNDQVSENIRNGIKNYLQQLEWVP